MASHPTRQPGRSAHPGLPLREILAAIIFTFPFFIQSAEAQIRQHQFSRLTTDDGLSSFRVFSIVQDSTGFIWMGTVDGVNRYDGNSFKVFRHDDTDSTSISENLERVLCVDAKGTLWVGTVHHGLNKFDPITETFIRYEHDPKRPESIVSDGINALCETVTGKDGPHPGSRFLWIGTNGGLDRLDIAGNGFQHFLHDPHNENSLSNDTVFAIAAEPSGTLWIATSAGLDAFDAVSGRFTHFGHDLNQPKVLHTDGINAFLLDHRRALWIGTAGEGVERYDIATGAFTHFTIEGYVISMLEENDRFVWVGTNLGLNRFDRADDTWTVFKHSPSDPSSLLNSIVWSLCCDRSGNIWIATDYGVSRFSPPTEYFQRYTLESNPQADQTVGSIAVDDADAIWIGTNAYGIRRFDKRTGSVTSLVMSRTNPRGIPSKTINALSKDSRGTMWAAGSDPSLLARYAGDGQFITYPLNSPVFSLLIDRRGLLWLGMATGEIKCFDPKEQRFLKNGDGTLVKKTFRTPVYALMEARNGTIWIATEGEGMYNANTGTGEGVQYINDPKNINSLSNDRVYSIHEDGSGNIWIATASGLEVLEPKTRTFKRYHIRENARDVYFIHILEDNRGHLWLSTLQSGLYMYDPATDTFRHFIAAEGLQSNVFVANASAMNRNGQLIMGGRGGFNIFHPDSLGINLHAPPVVVTEFRLLSNPAGTQARLSWQNPPQFSFNQNYFVIGIASLEFTCPEKNSIQYKLEPIDTAWLDAGNQRSFTFPNLADNKYVFRVKASNNDGIWNEQGIAISITINPPYWKTWWFVTLLVFVVAAIITGVYNYRIRQLLAMERMRVRIASDLHDDVGSSISGIALMTDLVRSHLPQETKDYQHLVNVSQSARTTADTLRDIVWIINPEHDRLEDIVVRMRNAADILLLNVNHTFSAGAFTFAGVLNMEFRRNLLLIYKEILNNIAKHAKAKNVDISLGTNEESFTLRIVEDGIGFDLEKAREKGGNGLLNLQHRASQIGSEIAILTSPGHGTSTTLTAKIPQSRYGRTHGILVFLSAAVSKLKSLFLPSHWRH